MVHNCEAGWVFYNNRRPKDKFEKRKVTPPGKGLKFAVVNFEDQEFRIEPIPHEKQIGRFDKRRRILVLRDPFNMFASRIKLFGKNNIDKWVQLWKQHARSVVDHVSTFDFVDYNRWFENKTYRNELADRFHLSKADAYLNRVATKANGSSFDGTAYDGKGQSMKIGERWKQMLDNDVFIKAVTDVEVIDLAREIFGEIEPILHLEKL
jgi:hypothetical protein